MAHCYTDPVMVRIRTVFESSPMSMRELGERMGYRKCHARQIASRMLKVVRNPRIATVRRFAAALGVEIKSLME